MMGCRALAYFEQIVSNIVPKIDLVSGLERKRIQKVQKVQKFQNLIEIYAS